MMKKGGSNPRGQRPHRQGGGSNSGGRSGSSPSSRRTPSGGGGGGGGGGGAAKGYRRGPGRGRPPRGPTACPMCGAVVADLKGHIQSKHDDPASHPRE